MGARDTVRSYVWSVPGVASGGAKDVSHELLAVIFMDVKGYSTLIARDGVGTAYRLRLLRHGLVEPQARAHGGHLAQAVGDSFILLFKNLLDGMRCALTLQRLIPSHAANADQDHPIVFRIGADIGDVLTGNEELHGNGVNIAARLQTLSPAGGLCVSRAVHDRVRGHLGVAFEPLDEVKLKNIEGPMEAFVCWSETVDAWGRRIAASPGPSFPDLTPLGAHPGDSTTDRPYPVPAGGPPRIAVLPFRQSGGIRLANHIRNGLAEDIVEQLAGLRELRVISHGSTVGSRGLGGDAGDIGRRLAARYLVRGVLRREEGRLKITHELVLAENAEVLWKETIVVDEPLSFDVQDRVVTRIVARLAPRVQDMELRRIRGKRPEQLSVYERVLQAREHITLLERDRFAKARILLDDVMASDPGYADAYALAAEWHVLNLGQDWSRDRKADTAAIDRMTRTALHLDGDNVRALICDGHRKSLLHRDFPAAMDMFRRAQEVSPHSARVWQRSSFTWSYAGDATEAIRRARHALELSPRDREAHWFHSALCIAHYTAGDYDEAADWGLRALGEQTMLRSTAGWAAAALYAAGREAEAKEVAARTMAQWPERRVRTIVAHHPYGDAERRLLYGKHLVGAGFP